MVCVVVDVTWSDIDPRVPTGCHGLLRVSAGVCGLLHGRAACKHGRRAVAVLVWSVCVVGVGYMEALEPREMQRCAVWCFCCDGHDVHLAVGC